MWGTLTISVCTLWLGLFWTLGGWWSPQPSHPAGTDRWRVVVHHQNREHNVIHTDIPILFGIVVLVVKRMKTTYVVYAGWDKLSPLHMKKIRREMIIVANKLSYINTFTVYSLYLQFFFFIILQKCFINRQFINQNVYILRFYSKFCVWMRSKCSECIWHISRLIS